MAGKTLKNVAGSALSRASCSKSSQEAMIPKQLDLSDSLLAG